MRRVYGFWKVVILDTLGGLFMVAALLTGWLPGPGGVPLFIIGLSLLAINHDWAKRLIDKVQVYADRIAQFVFSSSPRQQQLYDILTPFLLAGGLYLLWRHAAVWQTSVGLSLTCTALVLFFGNRQRWQRLKQWFKRKH